MKLLVSIHDVKGYEVDTEGFPILEADAYTQISGSKDPFKVPVKVKAIPSMNNHYRVNYVGIDQDSQDLLTFALISGYSTIPVEVVASAIDLPPILETLPSEDE